MTAFVEATPVMTPSYPQASRRSEPITCGMHGRRYDNEVAFPLESHSSHTRIIDESVLVERTLLPRFSSGSAWRPMPMTMGASSSSFHGRGD